MPRMQVYLPEVLYRHVKERALPVSELLQTAVAAELRRQDLLAETEKHLARVSAKVGEPTAAEQARADAWARGLAEGGLAEGGLAEGAPSSRRPARKGARKAA